MNLGSSSPDRVAAVGRMVTAHLPDARVGSVVQVGEGTDHLAYEVDGELIVRWSKERDAAARAAGVDREARLLAAVAAISPLPVPEPSGDGQLPNRDQPSRDLGERAAFYARCKIFEDLAYGIQTGNERYVDKSHAAMTWLFPA
jgi:aminoglycoside phosphotransferase (APT) family kinase protein